MADDSKITGIGVGFKKPKPDEQMLSVVRKRHCDHAYIIDAEASVVTCSKCDLTFNPMSVLVDLVRVESKFMRNAERYRDEMKRLSERTRTKCDSCGKMTRISQR